VFHIEREKIGFGYGTRVQYANNDANDNNNNAASTTLFDPYNVMSATLKNNTT